MLILYFSSPDHVRITDEPWIAKTSKYEMSSQNEKQISEMIACL